MHIGMTLLSCLTSVILLDLCQQCRCHYMDIGMTLLSCLTSVILLDLFSSAMVTAHSLAGIDTEVVDFHTQNKVCPPQ